MRDDGNKALTEGQDDQEMTHKLVISVGEGQEVSGILSNPEGEVRKGVILAHMT